jgi:uncharacterized protein YndB with AHSA1/START domain
MAESDAKNAGAAEQPTPLRLSRIFHAPRARVFEAWCSAEHVKRWFCPEGFIVPDAVVEAHVGGRFDLSMRAPQGEVHRIRGKFVEIAPHTRLVVAMQVTDATGKPLFAAHTEVEFRDAMGGTKLEVVQSYTVIDPAMAWMVAGAPEGWRTTLDKLGREVVRMRGGAETEARSVVHASFSVERSYAAPVARVWQALTDEGAKAKWFGGPPGRWQLLGRHMDVRVGGGERLTGRWEDGVVSTFDAVYHDVIPNERLLYSYVMHLDDKKISVSLATMELKSEGGAKTTLKLTEQGAFLDGYDDAGSREQGTGHLLDALGASLGD